MRCWLSPLGPHHAPGPWHFEGLEHQVKDPRTRPPGRWGWYPRSERYLYTRATRVLDAASVDDSWSKPPIAMSWGVFAREDPASVNLSPLTASTVPLGSCPKGYRERTSVTGGTP